MLAIEQMLADMSTYRFNPAGIQRAVFRALDEINGGVQLYFDATNPFIQALSAGAVETAAFMQEHEAESRRRYPLLAQTQEDLYLHMSDKDFMNRFAKPATAKLQMLFPMNELLAGMVFEPETGYMKLTVPRNTFFTVGGVVFSLQYPIDIRQLSHDGLQITYNNDTVSPLQSLESNYIEYQTVQHSSGEYIQFEVLTTQFSISQIIAPISLAKDWNESIKITDKFYYARAYHKNTSTGAWDELVTTHSDSVYDINKPTVVLHVADGVMTASVPQIYLRSGQLSSSIRVDMYETKGAINMPLADYAPASYSTTWTTYDATEANSEYFAALPNMNIGVASNDAVLGGSDEMSFETLRANVINNATGPILQAITPALLKTQLQNAGYGIVKDVDNITNRVVLATREMLTPTLTTGATAPSPSNKLLTAAAASIEVLTVSTESLAQLATVKDNGTSITITPDTLYQIVDGITRPVTQVQIDRLLALAPDKRAAEVTGNGYLYTPFHYVLDTSENAFEIRPYYLDAPVSTAKTFVQQNDTTLMLVTTGSYGLRRTSTGYALRVVTKSDSVYQDVADNQIFAQLAYIPYGERDRAYINGVLVGKTEDNERVFDFDLSTTFDVDANNNLALTTLTMYNAEPRITRAALSQGFDILYATSQAMTPRWIANDIDAVLGKHLLPSQIAGINHEKLALKFGDSLDMLWTRSRTVASSVSYETWDSDQQAFYKEDVYRYNADGTRLSVVNGALAYTKLHLKGDPILDEQGQITYEYRKGDFKRDASGNLIALNARTLQRQIELMLLEGVYWFATDPTTSAYRLALAAALVGWIVNDLNSFKTNLLDKTRIYFYPKTTSGIVNVLVLDDITKTISAGQAFNVILAVPKTVYDNTDLRDKLTTATVTTLSSQLQNRTVSVSQMISALEATYGGDVIDIQLSGLGGDNNYPVVTVVDDTDSLSIRKRLVAFADGTLAAEEDVTTTFILHSGS